METMRFITIIKGKFVDNDYVIGRISAAMDIVCKKDLMASKGWALYAITEKDTETNKKKKIIARVAIVETTQERYDRFLEIVRNWYPMMEFKTELVND